jgi:hypothetical protein
MIAQQQLAASRDDMYVKQHPAGILRLHIILLFFACRARDAELQAKQHAAGILDLQARDARAQLERMTAERAQVRARPTCHILQLLSWRRGHPGVI